MKAASDADHIPGIKKEGTRKSSGIISVIQSISGNP